MSAPRTKSIENGKLQVLSPSLLNAFDSSAAFGCERRGWFKYVKGLPEPTTDAMTRGTHLHAMNEEYLKTGKLLLGTAEQTAWFNAGRHFLDKLKSGPTEFESARLQAEYDSEAKFRVEASLPADFHVYGVPVSPMSKCDVVTESGIIDWKTTSDIEKHGKTPGQLAKDVQMLIYAKAFHPTAERVTLTHGQYQTKGRVKFHASSVELTRNELDTNYEGVILPLVEKVKAVAAVTDVNEVTPNRNACRTCPHSAVCPTEKASIIMSIFDRLKKSNQTSTPVPATLGLATTGIASDVAEDIKKSNSPVTASATVALNKEIEKIADSILPPDAPPSKPELAAKPVEGFEAVPAPRRNLIIEVPAPVKYTSADLQLLQKGDDPLPDNMDVDGVPFRRNGTRVYPPSAAFREALEKGITLGSLDDGTPIVQKPGQSHADAMATARNESQARALTPEKKRGPGRPPGAKNKPKNPDALVVSTGSNVPVEVVANNRALTATEIAVMEANQPKINYVQFESVTVNYGLTLNLGNFNSVRFDVTMGAKGSNPDATYEAVMARVRAKVTEEIEKIQAEQKAAQTLNPNPKEK